MVALLNKYNTHHHIKFNVFQKEIDLLELIQMLSQGTMCNPMPGKYSRQYLLSLICLQVQILSIDQNDVGSSVVSQHQPISTGRRNDWQSILHYRPGVNICTTPEEEQWALKLLSVTKEAEVDFHLCSFL